MQTSLLTTIPSLILSFALVIYGSHAQEFTASSTHQSADTGVVAARNDSAPNLSITQHPHVHTDAVTLRPATQSYEGMQVDHRSLRSFEIMRTLRRDSSEALRWLNRLFA